MRLELESMDVDLMFSQSTSMGFRQNRVNPHGRNMHCYGKVCQASLLFPAKKAQRSQDLPKDGVSDNIKWHKCSTPGCYVAMQSPCPS